MPGNSHHTLGTLELPRGMIWRDEFDWRPVESSREYGVTGAQIIDVAERQAGRPITLTATQDQGWMQRDTLLALYALAEDPEFSGTFTHADGRAFEVTFAPGAEPISAAPLSRPELPPAHWPYIVTLRLIEV